MVWNVSRNLKIQRQIFEFRDRWTWQGNTKLNGPVELEKDCFVLSPTVYWGYTNDAQLVSQAHRSVIDSIKTLQEALGVDDAKNTTKLVLRLGNHENM